MIPGGYESPIHYPGPSSIAVDGAAEKRGQAWNEVGKDPVYLRFGGAKERSQLADGEIGAEGRADEDKATPQRLRLRPATPTRR